MVGHPGAWVSTTLGIVSAFLPLPIHGGHGRPLVVAGQAGRANVARFLPVLSIMGLQDQLAPQRSDDPHAVFALKGRN
jgi:hypothetical protein